MDQKSSSTRMADAMARARRQWQTQRQREAPAETAPARRPMMYTIALSREAGANGSLVACALGERLGWPVYDRELVQQVAADMGVRAGLLESLDEKHRSWLLECMEAFNAAAPVNESTYCRHLLETLLSLGAHGECVIVGRAAAQALPAASTLRVRLIGRLEDRVKIISERLGIAPVEARRWVEQTDVERTRFVKDHLRKDPTDPQEYDLVLNTSRFSVAQCADLIIEALHRLQQASTAGEREGRAVAAG